MAVHRATQDAPTGRAASVVCREDPSRVLLPSGHTPSGVAALPLTYQQPQPPGPLVGLLPMQDTWEIYSLSWDEISGRKLLAKAHTEAEADELVDRFSELLPHAYVESRRIW